MTSIDVAAHDRERTIRNAWSAAEEVRNRLHNGAGSSRGEVIDAHVTPRPDEGFFWNDGFLLQFLSASSSSQPEVPGYFYFRKLEDFISAHYDFGPKHMEFLKDAVGFAGTPLSLV